MSVSGADPSVMLSLAAPAFIYGESGGEDRIDVNTEEVSRNSMIVLSLPGRLSDADINLASAFSINPIRVTRFAWKVYDIIKGLEASYPVSGSGSVSFVPSSDYSSGTGSLGIRYEDVSLCMSDGHDTAEYSLDGSLDVILSVFTDSLIDLSVVTDDISISGDTSASDSSVEIRFLFNSDAVYDYLQSFDIGTARRIVIGLLMRSPLYEKLGFAPDSGFEDVLSFAEEKDALDLIDSIAFILLALSDEDLSELDILSMVTTPVLYENGTESEDIDLSKAVDTALLISSIIG